MLDTITKKRIDDCRDILVGKLPDPKAQIEQITIGLIYKFMDDMDKEAIELGGSAKFFSGDFKKYSWDSLFDTKVTAVEMLRLYSEAIESMEKNPNIPQLFRDIFNNAYLPYRDPETLKLFLKTIGEFEYTHSEKLGDAFEYLLSVMGSQGDAGQFRTPRHIIDFLVAAVNPGKNDTILDPACGTAGFLISAFKHIKGKNKDSLTPDERKKLIQNFVGYDISPDMVRLSLVNLYLHGFSDPHITEYDTLSSEERWNENFDVILANPPFMSPKGGIRPHKKFTISSNRSEVLFVDYIAEHLNPKGRAGIIVPEGVIFQSGKAYKELRKMLVENYLYAVVSLPAGVFNPYSGVKTSILLMDKQLAKTSKEILFIKIDNDGYGLNAQRSAVKGGQLAEAIEIISSFQNNKYVNLSAVENAHAVLKTEIAKNGDYNLSGERYKVQDIESSIFSLNILDELVEVKGGKRLPKGSNYTEGKTPYPYIRVADFSKNGITLESIKYISPEIQAQISNYFINKDDVYISIAGTIGSVGIIPDELDGANLTENAAKLVIKDKNRINQYYLALMLIAEKSKLQIKAYTHSVGVPKLAIKRIKQIQIPLPPLSIQEEIVAEIEGYQKIIDGAKMVVENYKPKIDIDPGWEMVELGKVCKMKGGYAFKSNDYIDEGALVIRMGNVKAMFFDYTNNPKYLPKSFLKTYNSYVLKKGDILISMTGTVGKEDYGNVCMVDADGDFLLNQRVGKFEISSKLLDNDFLYKCANQKWFRDQIFKNSSGGVRQSNISNKGIEVIEIPLPELDVQKQIVAQLEKEQVLVNTNIELIEIFEQKIKDKIAKVWGE